MELLWTDIFKRDPNKVKSVFWKVNFSSEKSLDTAQRLETNRSQYLLPIYEQTKKVGSIILATSSVKCK